MDVARLPDEIQDKVYKPGKGEEYHRVLDFQQGSTSFEGDGAVQENVIDLDEG